MRGVCAFCQTKTMGAATFKQHPLFWSFFTIFAIYTYAAIDFCCDWMYYTIK